METACGVTWRQLNPLRSAAVARGITQVIYETRLGLSPDDARAKAGAITVDTFAEMVGFYDPDDDLPSVYEDGFPPKAAETSTSG